MFIYLFNEWFKKIAMFNKETKYALRALVYIQRQNLKGRRPGIVEIAKEIEAPQFYIAKILQRLVRFGFVGSLKGKGGGFYFDISKPDLPLKDLIVAIEGDKTFTACGFGLKQCNGENPCPMHEQYAPIREAINSMFTNETIQSFAKKGLMID